MPEYDFATTVREELEQLTKELATPNTGEAIREMAQRFGASEPEMLAALWRASKRHGETLLVFAGELRAQFERETAAATGAAVAAAPRH
ncbi:MAG: hypothetical protein ACRDI2_05785 [Chloroflexota bacterium]